MGAGPDLYPKTPVVSPSLGGLAVGVSFDGYRAARFYDNQPLGSISHKDFFFGNRVPRPVTPLL